MTSRRIYDCPFCYRDFQHPDDLSRHLKKCMMEHDPKIPKLVCQKCDNYTSYRRHDMTRHESKCGVSKCLSKPAAASETSKQDQRESSSDDKKQRSMPAAAVGKAPTSPKDGQPASTVEEADSQAKGSFNISVISESTSVESEWHEDPGKLIGYPKESTPIEVLDPTVRKRTQPAPVFHPLPRHTDEPPAKRPRTDSSTGRMMVEKAVGTDKIYVDTAVGSEYDVREVAVGTDVSCEDAQTETEDSWPVNRRQVRRYKEICSTWEENGRKFEQTGRWYWNEGE